MIGLGTSCCFNHHSNKHICTPALVPGGGDVGRVLFLRFYVAKKILLESFFIKQNCHFQMYLRIQSLYRDIGLMSGDHGLRGLRA